MWSLFGSVCEFFLIFGGQKWHKNMPKCIYFYINPAWHLVAPAVWNVRFFFQLRKTFFIYPFIWLWLVFYFFSSFWNAFIFICISDFLKLSSMFLYMNDFHLFVFLSLSYFFVMPQTTWFHAILLNNDIK